MWYWLTLRTVCYAGFFHVPYSSSPPPPIPPPIPSSLFIAPPSPICPLSHSSPPHASPPSLLSFLTSLLPHSSPPPFLPSLSYLPPPLHTQTLLSYKDLILRQRCQCCQENWKRIIIFLVIFTLIAVSPLVLDHGANWRHNSDYVGDNQY